MSMSKLALPGFTAEAALLGARNYRGFTDLNSRNNHGHVQPALPKLCDALSELVWGAYNEGAYNRAQFWYNVMDSVGCFG